MMRKILPQAHTALATVLQNNRKRGMLMTKKPTAATSEIAGAHCFSATELGKLSRQLVHIQQCAFCKPRFEELLRLYQRAQANESATPVVQEATWRHHIQWEGPLTKMRDGVFVGTLALAKPLPGASTPLHIEVHYNPAGPGNARMRVLFPLKTNAADPGNTLDSLEKLNNQYFHVECSGDLFYPNFNTALLWNVEGTAIVSGVRVIAICGHKGELANIILTRMGR